MILEKGELGITYRELLSSDELHVPRLKEKVLACLKTLLQEQLVSQREILLKP